MIKYWRRYNLRQRRIMFVATKRVVIKSSNQDIQSALMQRALGCEIEESQEEFSLIDKELVLTKRKINKKTCPPDLSAIELVLNSMPQSNSLQGYTTEELLDDRERLVKLLRQFNKEGKRD